MLVHIGIIFLWLFAGCVVSTTVTRISAGADAVIADSNTNGASRTGASGDGAMRTVASSVTVATVEATAATDAVAAATHALRLMVPIAENTSSTVVALKPQS